MILLAVTIFRGPILTRQNVEPVDMIESLSIPIQQVARVVYDGGAITEEQKEFLNQIVEVDKIPANYKSYLSDPIKNLIREKKQIRILAEHKTEYILLWAQIGIQNPIKYVKAYVDQTKGYWYPDVPYWRYTDGIFENTISLTKQAIIPEKWGEKMEWIAWKPEEIPIYGLLWSPGFAVWSFLFLLGGCYLNKKMGQICLFVPLLVLWGTLLAATPVNAELRYIYSLFITLPVLFAVVMERE